MKQASYVQYLVSVHSRHDERVGAEVRPHGLDHLDELAERVPAVKPGEGKCPQDLGEEGEEGRQDVGDAQVQDEEVHPRDFGAPASAAGTRKKGLVISAGSSNNL